LNPLFWNITLAVVWMFITGSFTAVSFLVGFVVGGIILAATQPVAGLPHYQSRGLRVIGLVLFTISELVIANFRVARELLRPQDQLLPGVIDLPLDARTDVEITLLAVLITLTPGTQVIEITPDRQLMYVHSTNVSRGDIEAARRGLKDGFERRVLEVTR